MALFTAVNQDNSGDVSESGCLGNNPHPNLSLQGILFSYLRVVLQCDISMLLGCLCGDRNTDMRRKKHNTEGPDAVPQREVERS